MTKLLEQAVEAMRKLPEQRQAEVAEVVISIAAEQQSNRYTKAQLDALDEGIADADAGRFASDEEVAALFDKYRPA